MAAFFGIEARDARGFIGRHKVCLPHATDGNPDLQYTVAPLHREDIVFIKHCDTPRELSIRAVGVLQSDYPSDLAPDVCLPVDWVWQGEKTIEQYDESLPLCGKPFYEEHNIVIQREILELLADGFHMPRQK